jgi:hypothetical protein
MTTGVQDEESLPDTTDVGRVWLRGLCFNIVDLGHKNLGWAIRLHFIEFTPTERTTGIIKCKRVAFGDSIMAGRMYDIGPIGFFTYVVGIYRGGIEIQEN